MARAIVLPQIGELVDIDSCLEESHQFDNTVTDHPVESGANISDHCRPNADKVSLKCWVSNTPLSEEQVRSAVRAGNADFQTRVPGNVEGRGENAYKKLRKMREEGMLLKIVTSLRTYGGDKSTEGMVIESLSIPRALENIDGLEFTVGLKQIRIVKTRAAKDTRPKDKRAATKKGGGEAAKKKGEEDTDAIAPIHGYSNDELRADPSQVQSLPR